MSSSSVHLRCLKPKSSEDLCRRQSRRLSTARGLAGEVRNHIPDERQWATRMPLTGHENAPVICACGESIRPEGTSTRVHQKEERETFGGWPRRTLGRLRKPAPSTEKFGYDICSAQRPIKTLLALPLPINLFASQTITQSLTASQWFGHRTQYLSFQSRRDQSVPLVRKLLDIQTYTQRKCARSHLKQYSATARWQPNT